jgi:hypothetical protein
VPIERRGLTRLASGTRREAACVERTRGEFEPLDLVVQGGRRPLHVLGQRLPEHASTLHEHTFARKSIDQATYFCHERSKCSFAHSNADPAPPSDTRSAQITRPELRAQNIGQPANSKRSERRRLGMPPSRRSGAVAEAP